MIQAIDVCVNPFFPQFRNQYTRLGYWKFFGGSLHQMAQEGWDVELLLRSMDAANVEMAGLVAFSAANPVNGDDCFIPAEKLKPIIDSHPRRFFGLVGVNPLAGFQSVQFAPRYIERAVKDLGFKAVHLALHWFDMQPGDKRLYPIYEKCLELGVPIVMPLGAKCAPAFGSTGVWLNRICSIR